MHNGDNRDALHFHNLAAPLPSSMGISHRMLKRFKHFLKIIIFIAYIHQNLVNVSNYKDNNFQEMLESFKHLNEKFHGEMRSGSTVQSVNTSLHNLSMRWLWTLRPAIKLPGPRNGCCSISRATSAFSPPLSARIRVGSPNSLTDANCRTVPALLLEQ